MIGGSSPSQSPPRHGGSRKHLYAAAGVILAVLLLLGSAGSGHGSGNAAHSHGASEDGTPSSGQDDRPGPGRVAVRDDSGEPRGREDRAPREERAPLAQERDTERGPYPGDMPYVKTIAGPEELQRALNQSDNNVLVMFYNPSCGHCQAMMPHFNEGASVIRGRGLRVDVLGYPASTFRDPAFKHHKVHGVPDIRLYVKGASDAKTYEGGFDGAEIVDFVHRHLADQ